MPRSADWPRSFRPRGSRFVGETAAAAADIDPDGPAPVGGEILDAPDAESETRAAVRLVIEHLAAGGVPERVALLFSSRDPYRRLIAGALEEAGISWNGPSPDRAADLAAAKVLTGLLGLATGGLERSAVMAWLRSAPLFAGDGTATPVGDWERVSRLAGIVGGDAAVWRRHLDALAEESRRALDDEGQFDGDEPTESSRTRSERLDAPCRGDDLAAGFHRRSRSDVSRGARSAQLEGARRVGADGASPLPGGRRRPTCGDRERPSTRVRRR